MTTLVRVAVASGQEGSGVAVVYGSQKADIPVGGVQTFTLFDSKPGVSLTICQAPCSGTGITTVQTEVVSLDEYQQVTAENAALKAELAAIKSAVAHASHQE